MKKFTGRREGLAGIICLFLMVTCCPAASVWVIEGGSSPVYLAGSVHFLRPGDVVPDVYETVYARSDLIVLEVEPHLLKAADVENRYLKAGRCPAGKQLNDYLDEETKALLEDRIKKLPSYQQSLQRMKPWKAGMFLTIHELTRLGALPNLGVDHVYYHKARRNGKRTASLESANTHIQMLASLTPQEELLFLKQTLRTLNEIESMFNELLGAWQQGDELVLAEWFHASSSHESGLLEKFLLKRNQNWISKLESYLQSNKPVMVIAGVGHLVGPGSVIDLLKKRGYTIRKLNINHMR